jgi:hypothetical protein
MTPLQLCASIVIAALAPHARVRFAKTAVIAVVALAGTWRADGLRGDSRKPTEYEVEAAYLANFAKFVEWPPGAIADEQAIPVCVIGEDPFGPALDAALNGEHVNDHPLVVRRISTVDDADECRILFIASNEPLIDSVVESVERMPILTVSDMPGFVKHGGMIEFVLDGNRVRFEINLAAVKAADLNVSSELLRVATGVRRSR